MRRKVIQIAESTQLISLPRKWCLANNIKKGDELSVNEKGSQLTVSCDLNPKLERAEIKLKDYDILAPRFIHALYKRGIDEIKVYLESPKAFATIQHVLSNETVGFEIIEQGSNYCVIKNVSSQIDGFDSVLRRTFLLLSNMADDCVTALQEKNLDALSNLLLLEQSNNRFTTLCRRYLNKYGSETYDKTGPLYYIVEDLENVADEYKYLFQQLRALKPDKMKIKKAHVEIYGKLAKMIRLFHESFYKPDNQKLIQVANLRKELIAECYKELENSKNADFILLHHALIIVQKVFNFIGPSFVLLQARSTQQ